MRRLPRVIASLSSEDTDPSAPPFATGDWSTLRLSSIPSVPFSEYSHPPYGEPSTGLSSVLVASPQSPGRPRFSLPGTTPTPTRTTPAATPTKRGTGVGGVGFVVDSRQPPAGRTAMGDLMRHDSTPSSGFPGAIARGRARSTDTFGLMHATGDGNTAINQRVSPSTKLTPKPLFPNLEENEGKKMINEKTQTTTNIQHSVERNGTTTKNSLPLISESTSKILSVHSLGTVRRDSIGENEPDDVEKNKPSQLPTKASQYTPVVRSRTRRQSSTTFVPAYTVITDNEVNNSEQVGTEKTVSNTKPLNRNVVSPRNKNVNERETLFCNEVESSSLLVSQEDYEKGVVNLPSSIHCNLKKEIQSSTSQRIIASKEKKTEQVESSSNSKPNKDVDTKQTVQKTPVKATKMSPNRKEMGNSNSSPSHVNSSSNRLIPPYRSTSSQNLVKFVSGIKDPEILLLIRDYVSQYSNDPRSSAIMDKCDSMLKSIEENKKKNINKNGNSKGLVEEQSQLPDDEDDNIDNEDEFDDYNIKNYQFPLNILRKRYSFATPIKQGKISPVFSTGMLYKILTDKGEYFFFNDTLQYVMVVRVRVRLMSNEVINEKAVLSPTENGETEITLAVLPEDTMFLIKGINVLPRVRAKGVYPPVDFVAPSVKQTMEEVSSAIEKVRTALGQWSRASDQKSFLKCCMSNSLPFTDLDFRPSTLSLFRPGVDISKIPPLTWRRPLDYLPVTELAEVRLFRQNISCHLVKQGNLEDHTVVAGIAAVAMFPNHVRWMFRHPLNFEIGKRERAIGAYRVTLCIGGWWTTVLLDDYFPASLKEPLFAHCPLDPRRLWVSFLEKAYAKILGSYSALCNADALDVLTDFTGYPCRQLDELWLSAVESPEVSKSLYNYIHRSVKRNFIVMVYTPSPKAVSASSIDLSKRLSTRFIGSTESMPLFLPGHVYFITETLYYEELDLRMVRLKNPWTWRSCGTNSNKKDWKKSKWFEQPENSISVMSGNNVLQAKRDSLSSNNTFATSNNITSCNDEQLGTMWLEWSEALTTFAGGGVCYTLWDWYDYRIKNCFRQGIPDVILEVIVKKRAEVILTLCQESNMTNNSSNNTSKIGEESNYDAVLLLVSRYMTTSKMQSIVCKSSNDLEVWGGKFTYHGARDVSLKCIFEPAYSPYYVFPRVHEQYIRKESPFVISLLCDSEIGGSDIQVRFCHLNSSCDVFKNVLSFTVKPEMCTPITASYQHRTTSGVSSYKGDCIKK